MKVLGIHRIIPVFPVQTSTPARSFSLTVVFCMSFDCSWQHIKEPPTHPDEGAPPVPATKRSDFTQSANLLPSVFADWEAQTSPGSAGPVLLPAPFEKEQCAVKSWSGSAVVLSSVTKSKISLFASLSVAFCCSFMSPGGRWQIYPFIRTHPHT